MLNAFVKAVFRKFGLDLRRLPAGQQVWNYPPLPEWMHTAPMPSESEMSEADYLFTTLGNRTFRSDEITLRRTKWGEDYRLKYILMMLDVRGLNVLELGPYWGYHTFMLDKLGAAGVVAVEGRESNIRVCEKVKQRYGLDHATFVLQNIENLAKGETPRFTGSFDLVFCLGLLYHLPAPLSTLAWCRQQAKSLFLGTHYFEPAERQRYMSPAFTADAVLEQDGKTFEGVWFREGGLDDGPSGLSPRSFWPREPDLIAMLKSAGYSRINVLGRDLQNNSPHIMLLAEA